MLALICTLLLLVSCQKYQGPRDFVAMQDAIDQYGQKIARANGLRLLLVDNVTKSSKSIYCLAFTCDSCLRLPEAKSLAENLVTDFLKMLQSSQSVKRYALLKEEMPKRSVIGLKISFWDCDINRIAQPYIAEIQFYDDTFFYYVADSETQQLRLVYKESHNLI